MALENVRLCAVRLMPGCVHVDVGVLVLQHTYTERAYSHEGWQLDETVFYSENSGVHWVFSEHAKEERVRGVHEPGARPCV